MQSQPSLFDRWISRPRRPWLTACVAALLPAVPSLAAGDQAAGFPDRSEQELAYPLAARQT